MSIRKSILTRVRLTFLVLVVLAGVLITKIIDIQFVEGERWRSAARDHGLQFMKVKATRGNIFTANGHLLATSLPLYRVAIDPTISADSVFDQQVDSLSLLLASFFQDQTAADYDTLLRTARASGRQYKVLGNRLVTHLEKKQMNDWPLFRLGRSDGGVIFEKKEKRYRPYEPLARRTLGFVNNGKNGLQGRGLEYSFNDYLSGKDGDALYQRIVGGQVKLLDDEISQVRAQNGMDIQTTLDIDFQQAAGDALEKALIRHDANYGVAIVMEVATGEIKALVNLSDSEEGYIENYNYAVASQGVAEPGSTFKLASLMALLEETNISTQDSVNTTLEGEYEFYEDCIMRDASITGYGMLSVQEVFEKSSNIGVSKLIFRYFSQYPERYLEYLQKFGLTDPLNFQMSGAGEPVVGFPGDATWSGCSLPWMSIGYETKLSPLQLLTFYNGVANGGKLIEPIIVRNIMRGNQVEKPIEARVITAKMCSDRTLFTVKGMLEGVVTQGTAKNIFTEEYAIAGKTGTAHKLQDGQYIDKYYTSFAGYFPADAPKYSCIVVIDDPKVDEKYGGKVAAPVFREIADNIFKKNIRKPLKPSPQLVDTHPVIRSGNIKDLSLLADAFSLNHLPLNTHPWVKTRVSGDTIKWVNNNTNSGQVPNVTGMSLRDALYLLENNGLRVKVMGKGRVTQQSLKAGTKAPKGSLIYLSLSQS